MGYVHVSQIVDETLRYSFKSMSRLSFGVDERSKYEYVMAEAQVVTDQLDIFIVHSIF